MDGKPLLLSLKQRDIVVRYHKHPDEIRWTDMDDLRPRLFRIRKFDVNGTIYMDNLYAAKLDDSDRNTLFFQVSPTTIKVIPVMIGVLGNVKRHPEKRETNDSPQSAMPDQHFQ
jgi:hypothetical protein